MNKEMTDDFLKQLATELWQDAQEAFATQGRGALLVKFLEGMSGPFEKHYIALDRLPDDFSVKDPVHFLSVFGRYTSAYNLHLVPVTNLSRDGPYQSAVSEVMDIHKEGACIRITQKELENASIIQTIEY